MRKQQNKPGMVVHACNSSYPESGGRRIMVRGQPQLKYLKNKFQQQRMGDIAQVQDSELESQNHHLETYIQCKRIELHSSFELPCPGASVDCWADLRNYLQC
jgi:hypothetical protein